MAHWQVGGDRDARGEGARRRPRSRLGAGIGLLLLAGLAGLVVLVGTDALRGRGDPSADASPAAAAASATIPAGASATDPSAAPPFSAAPSSAGSSASPASGLIAVVDDTGALVTLDDRGGSHVSYPTHGAMLGFPAWSPDGSRIAVVAQGAAATAIDVFTVDRGSGSGAEPIVIYRSADRTPFYLYWTPDGRRVSFLTNEAVGIALRVAPVDGSAKPDADDEASVIRRGNPLYFDWLGAERVLLHVGSGSGAFTGQVGLDGVPIGAPIDASGLFRTPSLSRDGRYVAYTTSAADTTGEIVVETADGSAGHRIPAFGPAAIAFDPTGDTLATVAADKPAAQPVAFPLGPLRVIDPASGVMRTLLDRPVLAFFWAPDGRTIVALRLVGPGQAPQAAVGRLVLARHGDHGRQGAGGGESVGLDVGLSFVDVSTGAIRSERVVRLADAFVGQLLPYFDQYALSHQLWSPDSASVLLPVVDPSGADQLLAIPADGTDPRPLAHGGKGFWRP